MLQRLRIQGFASDGRGPLMKSRYVLARWSANFKIRASPSAPRRWSRSCSPRQLTLLAAAGRRRRASCRRASAIASAAELIERADLIIAIGGDGTLLYAAGLVAERGTPLLGINRGRLGFLTDVLPQDMARCARCGARRRVQADRSCRCSRRG